MARPWYGRETYYFINAILSFTMRMLNPGDFQQNLCAVSIAWIRINVLRRYVYMWPYMQCDESVM